MKLSRFIFILILASFLVYFYLFSSILDQKLHIVFCNVGQGDAILLSRGNTQLLIDGGPDNKVISCLEAHLPPGDRVIEYLISTHPDADHVTGLVSVLQKFQVKEIFLEQRVAKTKIFEQFRQEVIQFKKEGGVVAMPQANQQLNFDTDLSGKFVFPFHSILETQFFNPSVTETQLSALADQQVKVYGETNTGSINILINFGHQSFLFTGDIPEEGELAIVNAHLLGHITVLKSPHHGSKYSNPKEFLNYTRPEAVVISVGKNNRFGHPHQESLENFAAVHAKILRTDRDGEVEVIADGSNYSISTSKF